MLDLSGRAFHSLSGIVIHFVLLVSLFTLLFSPQEKKTQYEVFLLGPIFLKQTFY